MTTQAASVSLNMFTRPDPTSGMKYWGKYWVVYGET
jgi:hypothetical protein